ncbi:LamG domain-containing protein [Pirellulales bacterium]|nr:LamG domain-containing protein [Pirellulales bacterium]
MSQAMRTIKTVAPSVSAAAAFIAVVAAATVSSAALVAHYRFDGNATDSVTGGAANDGVENGGVGYSAGQVGQALDLDGVDDYVVIPDGGGAEVGAADYSIAFWVKTTDNDASLVKTGTSGGPGNGIRALDSGNFGAFCGDGNGVFQIDDGGSSPYLALADPAGAVDGTWHHYALVRDATAGTATLYEDGSLATVGVGCGGQPANPMAFPAGDVTSPGEIGHVGTDLGGDQLPTGDGFLEGLIDDLRFYDHALTQNEAADLAGIPEPTTCVLLACGLLGLVSRRNRQES